MPQQQSGPEILKTLGGILMMETVLTLEPAGEKGDPEAFRTLHDRLQECDALKRLTRTYAHKEKECPRLMILFALWLFPRADQLPRTRNSLTRIKWLRMWIAQQRASVTADPTFLDWFSQMCDAAAVVISKRQRGTRGRLTQIPRLDGLWLAVLAHELRLQGIRSVYDTLADLLAATSLQDDEKDVPKGEKEDLLSHLSGRVRFVRKHFKELVNYWYDEVRSEETLTLFKRVERKILTHQSVI